MMKKSVFATLMGVALGILMMVAVIVVLNMKPSNEEVKADENQNTQTESNDSIETESQFWDEDDTVIEDVIT